MFSVVIPLYNKELSIGNTIQSVLNQTYQDYEIIIVNDGSTDNSLHVVEQINDSRIRIITKPNGGVSSARNRGIKEAKYDWIAFLDADDFWKSDHLITLHDNIIKHPEYKIFCNSYSRSFKEQNIFDQKHKIKIINDYFKEALNNLFCWTGVVCIKRPLLDEVGFFNEKLSRGEDLEIWMNIGRNYPIVWTNKITAIYNQESENKLTRSNIPLNKCIENYLDFKNKSSSETEYLQMLANGKIISLIKQLKFIDALKLIFKYNINLIKKNN